MVEKKESVAPSLVTLSRDDLNRLLKEATARGAAQAAEIEQSEFLDNEQAARLFYGRDDRVSAWRMLRIRHAEIDALSLGFGRFRRWRKTDVEKLLTTLPKFAARAAKYRNRVAALNNSPVSKTPYRTGASTCHGALIGCDGPFHLLRPQSSARGTTESRCGGRSNEP